MRGRGLFTQLHLCASLPLLVVVAVLLLSAAIGLWTVVEALPSSPHALERDIVTDFPQASACVLLLHTRGVSGCAGQRYDLPLRQFEPNATEETYEKLKQPVVLVVDAPDVDVFFRKLSEPKSKFAQVVRGGFITTEATESQSKERRPKSFSPASTFPMQSFAPYREKDYQWNPSGLDVLKLNGGTAFPPLFLLSEEESKDVRNKIRWNKERMGYRYPQYVAKLNTEMWAEEYPNSFDCLSHKKCLPVGGYSVVSTLPALMKSDEVHEEVQAEECVLVLASLGNSNIFHNWDKGAEASLSGVIAGLAAYEAVSREIAASSSSSGDGGGGGAKIPKRRLAFGFLNSEGYGLAGSRRMAFEFRNQSQAISGCYLKDISYIVEIGSVGLATTGMRPSPTAEYFLHMTPDSERKNASVFDIFQSAAKSMKEHEVSVSMPSGTPGIPPSSLMSFQNMKVVDEGSKITRSIPGAVLTDFNDQIANKYLSSFFDDEENVRKDSLYAAAELISRALYAIAFDNNDKSSFEGLDKELLNSTVYGLSDCLLTSKPGMQCNLVQQVTDTSVGSVNLYPGVRYWPLANDQDPNDKSDLSRFIWSFLATRSEGLGPNFEKMMTQAPACDFPAGKLKCADKNQLCARWRAKEDKSHNGRCVNATIQYVPAWSGLLSYSVKSNKWSINGSRDSIVDEVWTESFWSNSVPSASVYLTEGYTYEVVLFLTGLGLTVAWFFGMRKTKSFTDKELKQY